MSYSVMDIISGSTLPEIFNLMPCYHDSAKKIYMPGAQSITKVA